MADNVSGEANKENNHQVASREHGAGAENTPPQNRSNSLTMGSNNVNSHAVNTDEENEEVRFHQINFAWSRN